MIGPGNKQTALAGSEHCRIRARDPLLLAQSRLSSASAIESKALCRDRHQSAALVNDRSRFAVGFVDGRVDCGASDARRADVDDAKSA